MAQWQGDKVVGFAPGQTGGSGAKEQAAADAAKAANDATITVYDKTTGQPTQVSKKTYDAMVSLGSTRYDLSKPSQPAPSSSAINKTINIPSVGGYTTFLNSKGEPFNAPTAQYQNIISLGGSLPIFTPSRSRSGVEFKSVEQLELENRNRAAQFELKKKTLENPDTVYDSTNSYEQLYQETNQVIKVKPQTEVFIAPKTRGIDELQLFNNINKQTESDYIGSLIANQPRSGVKDYFVPGFGKMVPAKPDPFTAGMEKYNGNAIDNVRTFNENVITGTKNIYNTIWNPVVQKGVEIINKNPEPFTRNVAKGVVEIGAGLPQLASGVILLPSAIIGSKVVERTKQTPKAAAETLVAPINEFNAEPTLAGKTGLATAYIGTAYVGARGLKGVKSDISIVGKGLSEIKPKIVQTTETTALPGLGVITKNKLRLVLKSPFEKAKPSADVIDLREVIDLTKPQSKYYTEAKANKPKIINILDQQKAEATQTRSGEAGNWETKYDASINKPSVQAISASDRAKVIAKINENKGLYKSDIIQNIQPSFAQYSAITGAMASAQRTKTRQITNSLTEQNILNAQLSKTDTFLNSVQETKQLQKVYPVSISKNAQNTYQITKQSQQTQQATQQIPISIALPKLDVPQKTKQTPKFDRPVVPRNTPKFPKTPTPTEPVEPTTTKKPSPSDSSNDNLNFKFTTSLKSKKQSTRKSNPWYPASLENVTQEEFTLRGKSRATHITNKKTTQKYAKRLATTGQSIPTLAQSKSKKPKSIWRNL